MERITTYTMEFDGEWDEWKRSGIREGQEYGILINEITQAWADMNTKQYKKFKNLRDNMSKRWNINV